MFRSGRYLLLFILLLISFPGLSQLRPLGPGFQQRIVRQNRIEQVRESYLTRRLDLSGEQAARFWPTYRRYQDALTAVREKKRLNNSRNQPDGEQQIKNELYFEGELVKIRQFYTDEFLKILPPEKVSEMFKAEREFTDELIRQLRERQVAGNPGN